MRWMGGRESDQVEDDRGGIGPVHIAGGGIGVVVLAIVIGLLTGHSPLQILQLLTSSSPSASTETRAAEPGSGAQAGPEDNDKKFVRVILADTEDTWKQVFQEHGRQYRLPNRVLFDGSVSSACGMASAAVGPFYCPEDAKVYLDLSFFRELSERFGAPGDFARAYVIAHEVGHHVQTLLGLMPESKGHNASIAVELQADCFAGVWGNRSQAQLNWLQAGDVDAALNAASAVGDDALQKQSRGYAVPDSFTHGTSAQRSRWFKTGFASGDIKSCDTFSAAAL